MTVLTFPGINLANVPAMLRALADQIEGVGLFTMAATMIQCEDGEEE